MSTLRPFTCMDLMRFNNINFDHWTETVMESARGTMMAYMIGKSEGNDAYREWHAHVSAVTVAPEFRQQGCARRLMVGLEESGEREGCWFVDLFVRESNTRAVQFYRKLGYVVHRRVLGYYGGQDSEDALDMRKSLSRDRRKETMRPLGRPIQPWELQWN